MRHIISAICIIMMVSCNHIDCIFDTQDLNKETTYVPLTSEELSSLVFNGSSELCDSDAIVLVNDFIKNIYSYNISCSRGNDLETTVKILSKYYYQPSSRSNDVYEATTPIYQILVNYNDEIQIVYLGANKNCPDIISCTAAPVNNQDVYVKSGAAFLHEWSVVSYYNRLYDLTKKMCKLKSNALRKLECNLDCDITQDIIDSIVNISYLNTRAEPIDIPSTQIINVRGPFVKTEWSQDSPYNLKLPTPLYSNSMSHVYTGCAVTAACQLMTCIRPNLTLNGMKIDWDLLTETKKISSKDSQGKLDMVGELHKWVFNELGATPQYENYEHTGTGVTADAQVWFYGNYFDHSEDYCKYDPDVLLKSFNQGRPSLIRGQGHAWLLDGYIIAEKSYNSSDYTDTRSDIIKIYDIYWHANLGWGGAYNGYYKLDADTNVSFESGPYKFTTDGLFIYAGLFAKSDEYNF